MIILPPPSIAPGMWELLEEVYPDNEEVIDILKEHRKNMKPVKSTLFETPPVEGELWWDVQFEMNVDPGQRIPSMKWLYFSGVSTFKSKRAARGWIKKFTNRINAARIKWVSLEMPTMRMIPHFEPIPENAWVGTPVPGEFLPKP